MLQVTLLIHSFPRVSRVVPHTLTAVFQTDASKIKLKLVDVLLTILHSIGIPHAPGTRIPTSTSFGNGNTLNRHKQGEFDREQRVVVRSVESQVDVSLESSRMNPFEKKLLKRAHSPVERVCHDLKFKWAQQDRNELATFTLSRSHMHLSHRIGRLFCAITPSNRKRATKPRIAIDEHNNLEGTKHQPKLRHRLFKKIREQISYCSCRYFRRSVSCNEDCTLSTMK